MENWFYVDGAKQVGPVSKDTLIKLFDENHISLETYVWKKGLAQWERYKNVDELMEVSEDFFEDITDSDEEVIAAAGMVEEDVDLIQEEYISLEEEKDLSKDLLNEEFFEYEDLTISTEDDATTEIEMNFIESKEVAEISEEEYDLEFSWQSIEDEDEMFFIKIGQDRTSADFRVYGPYSINELREAYEKKRISSRTLLTSAGLDNWTQIHNTPVNELFFDTGALLLERDNRPYFSVNKIDGMDVVGLIKNVTLPKFELNVSKYFNELVGKTIYISIYQGANFKHKHIPVKVVSYDVFKQVAKCEFINLTKELEDLLKDCYI